MSDNTKCITPIMHRKLEASRVRVQSSRRRVSTAYMSAHMTLQPILREMAGLLEKMSGVLTKYLDAEVNEISRSDVFSHTSSIVNTALALAEYLAATGDVLAGEPETAEAQKRLEACKREIASARAEMRQHEQLLEAALQSAK